MVPARWLLGVVLCTLPFGATASAAAAPGAEFAEAQVRRIETLLGQARFREAAEQAPSLRRTVLAMPPSSTSRQLLVRTEVAAATAALALRQEMAARICFLRALQLEPALALNASAPPKVRRVFDAVRGGP